MCSGFIIIFLRKFIFCFILIVVLNVIEELGMTRKEMVPFQEIQGLLLCPVLSHRVRVGN